ncbi:MAG: aminotransferase class I/II-fold pyridoxal phosphate-dependent enzyme [Chromatiales bacterium]|nr:aminotransferase class I/II-fold pyridoxal phosphate-dependent enzyme [Chromatiales bacterium]
MNADFQRIKRLPPYVFNIVNELKAKARAPRRGHHRLRHGQPRPADPAAHRRQAGRGRRSATTPTATRCRSGIPRLRRAICNWYQTPLRRGSRPRVRRPSSPSAPRKGLAHLALATMGPGDAVLVPNPAYPIHPYGFVIAGADIRHVPLVPGVDFFAELEKAIKDSWPQPEDAGAQLPGQPDHPVRRTGVLRESRRHRHASTTSG